MTVSAEEYKAVIAQQDALLEMRLTAPVTPTRYEQSTYLSGFPLRSFLFIVC